MVESQCLNCSRAMLIEPAEAPGMERHCPHCSTRQVQQMYPALVRPPAETQSRAAEAGAGCFFHDSTAASGVCEDCGCYLCALCSFPDPGALDAADGPRLCPVCFARHAGDPSGASYNARFRTRYPRHDLAVLFLVLLPVVILPFFLFVIVTAPMALFLAIRHGGKDLSPVSRSKALLTLGAVAALFELLIWSLFMLAMVVGAMV